MMKTLLALWLSLVVYFAAPKVEAGRGPFSSADFFKVGAASITTPPFSIFCWVYLAGSPAVIENFFGIGASTGTNDKYYIRVSAAGKAVAVTVDNAGASGGAANSVGNMTVGGWNAVLGVWGSGDSDRRISLNNEAFVTSTTTRTVTAANVNAMSIGRALNSANPATDAWISSCAVWNTTLTQADSGALASGVSPLLVQPSALLDYWPLLGVNSPENDEITNTYSMPMNGTVSQQTEPPMFRAG